MALIAYTGVMGSGKSYEGVATAALTALRQGRRVVTNIGGFNYEAIRDYLGELKSGGLLEPEKVLVIPSKRISEPDFFYDPENPKESVVKPGDLVLIDEVWAFWGTDSKLLPEHQKFFRMHRHYTEVDSGTSCDLVIMIQDLSSLTRSIRGVLESNFKFTKLKTLGFLSRYRVEVYEGNKQRKANLVSVSIKKYNKRIFPLYKSYDSGVGKESIVDGRLNLLKNKWFLVIMVSAVVFLLCFGRSFNAYFRDKQDGADASKPVASQSQITTSGQSVRPSTPPVVNDVRLVGLIEHGNGETTVVFQLADGRMVRQRMDSGLIDGWQTVAGYQGRMAAFYFGSKGK